ncbi:hypothetical protein PF005_g28851 [Phytophthora fragariae]|uniref:Uncharacterized protein n=1 Tax=Phytophthora fragariae TaxID=53985 RepID=A0A6A3XCW0_9STRA|nr:hypothetical protein PF003_g16827 [Phytophthora fragariae]KAE8934564.1 hypothetical protein PF009_g15461 [Phytophthora fragariae]KAE9103014.1 hypothetical protein PF007_g14542 [Phytophthora fragariae]KAE9140762.1 hypothetical protein PF006_g13450 [Phytophthora fragariae]KAE9167265.1 hypothetical protein PF005_g28851 [Phytophthora fragariae]
MNGERDQEVVFEAAPAAQEVEAAPATARANAAAEAAEEGAEAAPVAAEAGTEEAAVKIRICHSTMTETMISSQRAR